MRQSLVLRHYITRQQAEAAERWEDSVGNSRQQPKRCTSNHNHVLLLQAVLRAVSAGVVVSAVLTVALLQKVAERPLRMTDQPEYRRHHSLPPYFDVPICEGGAPPSTTK